MDEIDDLCHIYDVNLFDVNDFDILLHEILNQTRSILNAEAGSIYINEGDSLSFNIFQNDAMSYENVYRQFYSLKDLKLPLSEQEKYLAVQSFTNKKIIIVDDVYEAKEYDFLGVKEFDKKFDYRTHSIITAPIIHPLENITLGVIQLLNKKEDEKQVSFNDKDKKMLSMISSFVGLSIYKAQNDIEKLKQLNQELEESNAKLQERVEEEVKQSQKKSSIIYHQSKLVSMGEMIGNIAHQWRQPLSAISTAASGLSFNIELGNDNKDDTIKSLDKIVKTTQHLSQTIDDFRNFYKVDKNVKRFNLAKNILSSLGITEATLSENYIQLNCNLDDNIYIYGFDNELKQAILNIIQNAKDALIESIISEEERVIIIDLNQEKDFALIKIKDNAGGIDKSIISKVFDQNFTTKEKSGGTGIGLYMSKQIIEKHMLGSIEVFNDTFKYKNKTYTGALFTIKIYDK
ncbi:MAG: hypothetical protein C0625_16135 [Arcobacter sp.]|nr:MAG: hypothetical protein C0625_16135 [Arcobacter sp.]